MSRLWKMSVPIDVHGASKCLNSLQADVQGVASHFM